MQSHIKFLLSFFKRDWKLTDYPIQTKEQTLDADLNTLFPVKETDRWVVRIPRWIRMTASGATLAEAYNELRRKFDEYKAEGHTLPRPGTEVPIQFAPRIRMERYHELADEFFRRILGMNYRYILITDASSLWDFPISQPHAIEDKIEDVYEITIKDIEDGNLVRIFERIEAQQSDQAVSQHQIT